MYAIAAIILRKVAMAVATGAIVTGGENLLDGTIKQLVYEIKDKEGVTEETAKDVIGDILTDLAINSALIFTSLQTGAGVKAAEFLGLTSKGVIKKGTSNIAKKTLTGKAAEVALKVAGPWEKFKAYSLTSKILSVFGYVGAAVWMSSAIANAVEPGIYKPKEANDLWESILGVRPFPDPKTKLYPGPFTNTSSVTFSDFASSLEAQGITGLKNPIKLMSMVYNREELADIVDYVYGQEITKGKALSVKELIPKMAEYLVIPKSSAVAPANASTTVSIAPITKVFTGIVSQGVVGAGLVFEARPDDMIESADELRSAAANNLAPFLNTLLGKIVYEVKVVSSVISKDGFRQTGTTQRIQYGTYKNGTPKYKTVTNKFATLVVYALTDKGSRAKLTTIVLGPTNSAKLTIGQNDLQALQNALPALVTTTDIKEIKGIKTDTPVSVTTPQTQIEQNTITTQNDIYYFKNPNTADKPMWVTGARSANEMRASGFVQISEAEYLSRGGSSISVPATGSVVNNTTQPATKPGASATTLFDWYQAQGQSLPSVSQRAVIYENLGLGSKSYYTGTAEQNTKLLNALKTT